MAQPKNHCHSKTFWFSHLFYLRVSVSHSFISFCFNLASILSGSSFDFCSDRNHQFLQGSEPHWTCLLPDVWVRNKIFFTHCWSSHCPKFLKKSSFFLMVYPVFQSISQLLLCLLIRFSVKTTCSQIEIENYRRPPFFIYTLSYHLPCHS